MNAVSSLLPMLLSATGKIKPTKGDEKGEKGDARADKKVLQQRKGEFLDKYIAAIMEGDFQTATKLRVELAKLDGVSLPKEQKAKYVEQLEKLRNEKGKLYNQLLASVAEGKDPPAGLKADLAKVDIIGNILQEALGLPKKKLELPPTQKLKFQADLEKMSQEKAALSNQLIQGEIDGKGEPEGVKQKLRTIEMLGGIMNEALGNSKTRVPLPRKTVLQYQDRLDRMSTEKGVQYQQLTVAILNGKSDIAFKIRQRIAKLDTIGGVVQEALGCPKKATLPIDRAHVELFNSKYNQASQEQANLQDQLIESVVAGKDPIPGIRARMAKLGILMRTFNEAVNSGK